MEPIRKKDKNAGRVAVIFYLLLLCVVLFFPAFKQVDPPFQDQIVIIDFAGSESSGGAPEEPQEEEPEPQPQEPQEEDPVEEVQEEESPVTASKAEKSKTSSSEKSTEEPKKEKPKNDFSKLFGGKGSSKGNDDGDKDGDGFGKGVKGPGYDGLSGGALRGRALLSKPEITNPTQEVADVVVAIWVDKNGKVVRAEARADHAKTNTNNVRLFKEAEKAAKKLIYAPKNTRSKLETTAITILFRLD